jgi:hypothetical protein
MPGKDLVKGGNARGLSAGEIINSGDHEPECLTASDGSGEAAWTTRTLTVSKATARVMTSAATNIRGWIFVWYGKDLSHFVRKNSTAGEDSKSADKVSYAVNFNQFYSLNPLFHR